MTREEAIQMIQNDMRLHHDYLSGDYRKALRLAIEALQQPEQRWISVTERLPETNGQYLVTRWNGFSPKEMIIDIARYANGEWHKAYPIEAYMPLPEPYKEEGEA